MNPDLTPDAVQPEEAEGQGGGGEGESLYGEYLSRIPEEARPVAEEAFKAFDANTTRKFQESAEFRSQWEPYQELGVQNLQPDEVKWLLEFRDAALNNPQAVRQWFEQEYAPQNGIELTPAQAAQADPPDEFGFVDPNAQLEQLLKSQLGPIQQQVEQFGQWREQQEQQARLAQANQMIEAQKAELKEKHPDVYDEARVNQLLAQYIESDPQNAVRRAFDDWQQIYTEIQKQTLQQKLNQPAPPEAGGVANGAPEGIRTLAEASKIALEQLRQANNA